MERDDDGKSLLRTVPSLDPAPFIPGVESYSPVVGIDYCPSVINFKRASYGHLNRCIPCCFSRLKEEVMKGSFEIIPPDQSEGMIFAMAVFYSGRANGIKDEEFVSFMTTMIQYPDLACLFRAQLAILRRVVPFDREFAKRVKKLNEIKTRLNPSPQGA